MGLRALMGLRPLYSSTHQCMHTAWQSPACRSSFSRRGRACSPSCSRAASTAPCRNSGWCGYTPPLAEGCSSLESRQILPDGTKVDFGESACILAFLGNGALWAVFCKGYNLPEASLTHLDLCPDVFEWDF
jgi:hypothetical protein